MENDRQTQYVVIQSRLTECYAEYRLGDFRGRCITIKFWVKLYALSPEINREQEEPLKGQNGRLQRFS